MESYAICSSFGWLSSLSMFSRFIHVVVSISIPLLFKAENILLYIYSTFSLCSYWWRLTLFLPFDCSKFCCHEHWCASIHFVCSASGYMSRNGISGSNGNSIFNFLRNYRTVFYSNFIFLTAKHKDSNFHPHQHLQFWGLLFRQGLAMLWSFCLNLPKNWYYTHVTLCLAFRMG